MEDNKNEITNSGTARPICGSDDKQLIDAAASLKTSSSSDMVCAAVSNLEEARKSMPHLLRAKGLSDDEIQNVMKLLDEGRTVIDPESVKTASEEGVMQGIPRNEVQMMNMTSLQEINNGVSKVLPQFGRIAAVLRGERDIATLIDRVAYLTVPDETVTICVIYIFGFSITGSEDLVDKSKYDPMLGREYAYEVAKRKALEHLAFLYAFLTNGCDLSLDKTMISKTVDLGDESAVGKV